MHLPRTILVLPALAIGLAGSAQPLLQEDFENTFPPAGWTISTPPSDHADGWTYGPQSGLLSDICVPQGGRAMVSQWATFYPNDAWAFTPALALSAGTTYVVSFKQCVQSPSSNKTESLRVTAGTQANIASQGVTLLDLPTLNNTDPVTRSATFTPAVSGVYHFAFNCYSAANQRYLSIDAVDIRTDVDASVPFGQELPDLRPYLDPATDMLTLQGFELHGPGLLSLIDVTGKTVAQQHLPANRPQGPLSLDLSPLGHGLYIVHLSGPGVRCAWKVVKQ